MNGLNNMIVKWGIVGLGNMANAFAKAISETTNSKLICVASKSKPKLELFAKNFDIATSNRFSNYSELIRSKEIDAVYISTLNNTHVELLLECVKNDKKILCEKPLGASLQDAKDMTQGMRRIQDEFGDEAMIVSLVDSLSNCLKTFFLISKSSIILSCIKIEFLHISSIVHLRTMFDFIFSILR